MATGSSPPARQQAFKVSPRPHQFQSNTVPLPPLVLTAGGFVASQLILGSSSVARKHIIEEMGLEFQVMVGPAALPLGLLCSLQLTALILPVRWNAYGSVCCLSVCGFRLRTSTRRASGERILMTW
jgi:hypothetical protein